MYTKAIPVLHKFTQLPNIIPDAIVVGTGNIMVFTPKTIQVFTRTPLVLKTTHNQSDYHWTR